MRNAIYPSYYSHLSNFGTNELQMLNFDTSANVCATNFFRETQVSQDLHLGSFSPMSNIEISQALTSTIEISQALTSLQIPAVLPNPTVSQSYPRFLESVPSVPETKSVVIKNVRKRNEPLDGRTVIEESKKMKAVCDDDRRSCPPNEDPSAPDVQEKKAPVKRSQKIGDKITALQKLVSPFGKTDTASVLQEAATYIKYLREQIQMLSAPYFAVNPLHYQGLGGSGNDLRSRGLCLVPVSFTQNLAKEEQHEPSVIRRCIIPMKD